MNKLLYILLLFVSYNAEAVTIDNYIKQNLSIYNSYTYEVLNLPKDVLGERPKPEQTTGKCQLEEERSVSLRRV